MDDINLSNHRVLKAREIKERGGIIAGTFCSFVPVEILDAAKIHIVNLCGTSNETIINSAADLPKNLCPLIKSSYGAAVSDKCTYTHLSDIIIGETTCDGKKKMYELLNELKDTHIMQLPQGANRNYSPLMWEKEVRLLIKTLEDKFGIEITEDKIREATSFRNKFRDLFGNLFELSKLDPPAITGFDAYRLLENYRFNLDLNEEYKQLEELINQIKKEYKEGKRPVDHKSKRILVSGCPLGGVLDKIVNTIEHSGGVVVCFENCGGIKPIRNNVDENSEDIIKAIATRYLNIGCSVMSPNDNRMTALKELIEEFNVDAVVEVVLQTCHPYSVETREIKRLTTNIGTPYMSIETDYSDSNTGQIKTRIAAFIEML